MRLWDLGTKGPSKGKGPLESDLDAYNYSAADTW
jgi:hypothetical protein